MNSESSSSTDDVSDLETDKRKVPTKQNKKRKKKAKKENKGKKDKKEKTKEKEHGKKEARLAAWQCDRGNAVRLIKQLLDTDVGVASELTDLFDALDSGELVKLDGLENKLVKKKLRHLLQALRLTPSGTGGFRSADKHVSFRALFDSLLVQAKPKTMQVIDTRKVSGTLTTEDVDSADDDPSHPAAPAVPELAKQRVMGPMLPRPGVGPSAGEVSDCSDDEDDLEKGPKMEGQEREGVDLSDLPAESLREEWMSMPHEALAGIFNPSTKNPRDRPEHFEIKRTAEEEKAFEEMVQRRGPSLLTSCREGKFADSQRVEKRQREEDLWGVSAKKQQTAPSDLVTRRFFNREEDLKVRKQVSAKDFSKYVEDAGSGLSGRFSRGLVATSFL